jgi:hypothetical protein
MDKLAELVPSGGPGESSLEKLQGCRRYNLQAACQPGWGLVNIHLSSFHGTLITEEYLGTQHARSTFTKTFIFHLWKESGHYSVN